MEAPSPRAYRFGWFRVDLVHHRLIGPDGQALPLSGRAYDVLLYLVENRAKVVTKDDLLKAVWPRVIVEENNLNQAISALRRALGDSRDKPLFILTVAGRGYRFIADVQVETDTGAAPAGIPPVGGTIAVPDQSPASVPEPSSSLVSDSAPAPPTARLDGDARARIQSRRWVLGGLGAVAVAVAGVAGSWWVRQSRTDQRLPRTIAVLPFKPLTGASGDEALELGMAETLINRLSSLPGVVVTPLSSVRRFSGGEQDPLAAGRELQVAAVIDGHVQVREDRVRLTARLLDVDDGTAIWSGSFDERLDDFFAVQDSLASQIVQAMAVDIPEDVRRQLVQRHTDDVEAWQLYLNGRYHFNRRTADGFRRALEFFEAAERRDPQFALPAAGLADVWGVYGVFGMHPPREVFPRARAAAERAIGLDRRLAEAHATLGHVLTQFERDWRGGERLYRLAIALKPTLAQAVMWLANNLVMQGRHAEAITQGRQAQSLEPESLTFAANVGMIRYYMREFGSAYAQLSSLVEAAPEALLPRRHLARVHLARGEARDALQLLDGLAPGGPGWFSDLGRALAVDGQRDAARAEIARLEEFGRQGFGVGYDIALVEVALGEHGAALAALERSVGDFSQLVGFLNSEPSFDSIRHERRFAAVSRTLGLG